MKTADPHYLIIAPHGDDEIIGCYNLLRQHPNDITIAYAAEEDGCDRTHDYFRIASRPIYLERSIQPVLDGPLSLIKPIWVVAPDPYFEIHPEHRYWGMQAETLCRENVVQGCLFYSTIMRTPYIYQVYDPHKKRDALDFCYTEKAQLWEYDHRYWLFEGMCQWHFHGVNVGEE